MYRYYTAVKVDELYAFKGLRCKLLDKGIDAHGIAWGKLGLGRNFDRIELVAGDKEHRTRLYDLGLEWEEHKKEEKNKKVRNAQARDIEDMVRRGVKRHEWMYTRAKYIGYGNRGQIVIEGNMEHLADIAYRFEHSDSLSSPPAQGDSALDQLFGGGAA